MHDLLLQKRDGTLALAHLERTAEGGRRGDCASRRRLPLGEGLRSYDRDRCRPDRCRNRVAEADRERSSLVIYPRPEVTAVLPCIVAGTLRVPRIVVISVLSRWSRCVARIHSPRSLRNRLIPAPALSGWNSKRDLPSSILTSPTHGASGCKKPDRTPHTSVKICGHAASASAPHSVTTHPAGSFLAAVAIRALLNVVERRVCSDSSVVPGPSEAEMSGRVRVLVAVVLHHHDDDVFDVFQAHFLSHRNEYPLGEYRRTNFFSIRQRIFLPQLQRRSAINATHRFRPSPYARACEMSPTTWNRSATRTVERSWMQNDQS